MARKVPVHQLEKAPISPTQRTMLRRDLDNIRATADRKQVTLDRWDEADESKAGREHFELGCWLFYYSDKIYKPENIQARIDCARRIYSAGFTHLGYEFFTVFNFGERQYDTLVECGDADEVIAALRALIATDTTRNLRRAFEYNNWQVAA